MERFNCYNISGEEVANIMNENMLPGAHSIVFDGSSLPPGTYIYGIETRRFRISSKMLIMK